MCPQLTLRAIFVARMLKRERPPPPMPAPETTFAALFEQLRLAKRWTPAEVARRLSVSAPQVSRWRSGAGVPSIQAIETISKVFGVDRETLEVLAGYRANNIDSAQDTADPEISALLESDRQAIREEFSGIPPVFWKPIIDARRTAGQLAVDNVKAALRIAREHLPFSESSTVPISNDAQEGETGASGDESATKKPFTRHYTIRNAKQHFANTSAALAL